MFIKSTLNKYYKYILRGGINMKLLFVYIDENNAQAYNYTTNDTYYLVKK